MATLGNLKVAVEAKEVASERPDSTSGGEGERLREAVGDIGRSLNPSYWWLYRGDFDSRAPVRLHTHGQW
jgi:hypothetical protein